MANAYTNTLTTMSQLTPATGVTTNSLLFINAQPQYNNVIESITLGALPAYLFLQGDILSNTGGTQSAYNLGAAFEFAPASTEGGLGSLSLAPLAAGEVLGSSVQGAPSGTPLTALLDQAFSSVEGALLVRGSTGWTALPQGESGYVLEVGPQGPEWAQGAAGPNIPASAPLLATTAENTFQIIELGANLEMVGSTLVAAGSNWALSDGTHVIEDISTLLVPGALLQGANGQATLTLEGAPWSISEGTTTITAVNKVSLVGAGVSLSGTNGVAQVSIPGGGGSAALSVGNVTEVTSIEFVGASVSGGEGTATVTLGASAPSIQDFYTYAPGTLVANQVLLSIAAVRPLAFPENAFSLVLDTAAAANTTFTVLHNGSAVGSLTLSAGQTLATSSTQTFTAATADTVRVLAPSMPDNAAAGASLSATATR